MDLADADAPLVLPSPSPSSTSTTAVQPPRLTKFSRGVLTLSEARTDAPTNDCSFSISTVRNHSCWIELSFSASRVHRGGNKPASSLNNLRRCIWRRNRTDRNLHDDHVILFSERHVKFYSFQLDRGKFMEIERKLIAIERQGTHVLFFFLLCHNPPAVPRIPFYPPLSGINVRCRFDSIPFHQYMCRPN
jgi:hypothetical protein